MYLIIIRLNICIILILWEFLIDVIMIVIWSWFVILKDSKFVWCVKVGLLYILYIVYNDRLCLVVFLIENFE